MPCEWLKGPGGSTIHINRGRSRSAKCEFCGRDYRDGKLCDFPIGEGRTCDAQMCSNCATTTGTQETQLGHGFSKPNDTIDLCPIHRGVNTAE